MSKKYTITDADIDLFRNTIGEVKPLAKGKEQVSLYKKPASKPQQPSIKQPRIIPELVDQGIHRLMGDDYQLYTRVPLSPLLLKKLRAGKFVLHAILDLHGLNVNQARTTLQQFIQRSHKEHHRCVCVIHGKGMHSGSKYPLMKNHVDQWLRQMHQVVAFCTAMPKHGGAGAVYVLLKNI